MWWWLLVLAPLQLITHGCCRLSSCNVLNFSAVRKESVKLQVPWPKWTPVHRVQRFLRLLKLANGTYWSVASLPFASLTPRLWLQNSKLISYIARVGDYFTTEVDCNRVEDLLLAKLLVMKMEAKALESSADSESDDEFDEVVLSHCSCSR